MVCGYNMNACVAVRPLEKILGFFFCKGVIRNVDCIKPGYRYIIFVFRMIVAAVECWCGGGYR